MRKIFLILLLLTLSLYSFSQKGTNSFDKEYYLKRSNGQKNAGFFLVFGGGVLVTVGFFTWSIGFKEGLDLFDTDGDDGASKTTTGTALVITGAAISLGSIPFFIAAGKNKKKAMSLSIKLQSVPQLKETYLTNFKTPSLTLKIQL